mmetsp:Transcript_6460/g.21247  ORF Transcript_6460/g.21247 Transcript_6460/m.21247 type:complete len:222 (+) Transcript_6460:321-986(+)
MAVSHMSTSLSLPSRDRRSTRESPSHHSNVVCSDACAIFPDARFWSSIKYLSMYSSMVVIASVIGTHSEKRALARMPPKADETSARITRTQCIQYRGGVLLAIRLSSRTTRVLMYSSAEQTPMVMPAIWSMCFSRFFARMDTFSLPPTCARSRASTSRSCWSVSSTDLEAKPFARRTAAVRVRASTPERMSLIMQLRKSSSHWMLNFFRWLFFPLPPVDVR